MINTRLLYLKNRHIGQRGIIVANGPSLNHMRLDFLRDETTIGMNKIYLGFKKFRFYPRYFVAVNCKVIEQSAEHIKAMNCIKFIPTHSARHVPESALTYHIDTCNPPHRFCHDITQSVHEGWTVTYAALQIAYYLGFKEVILIGLDHRYEYSGNPNEAKLLRGSDPNHFCSDYFGGGQMWDNPDLEHSEESFRIARQEFEKDGRRILDATVDGACTIFEKIDYKKYF